MKTLPLPLIYFFLSLGLLISAQTPLRTDPTYYYDLCAPSTCNNLTLSYSFTLPTPCHPPASTLQPLCPANEYLLLTNSVSTDAFRVLSANTTDPTFISFSIASNSLFTCGAQVSSPRYRNTDSVFSLPSTYTYGTHFNCTGPIPSDSFPGLQNASCIGCKGQDPSNVCYYVPGGTFPSPLNCERYIIYSLLKSSFNASRVRDLRAFLQSGFRVEFKNPLGCSECEASGGRCGANLSSGSFVCFCPSSVHRTNCTNDLSSNGGRPIGVGEGSKNRGTSSIQGSCCRGIDGDSSEVFVGDEKNRNDEDDVAIRRMSLVGLYCIQHIHSNIPTMDTVIQMLEGHVEIGIPSPPFPPDTTRGHGRTIQDVV